MSDSDERHLMDLPRRDLVQRIVWMEKLLSAYRGSDTNDSDTKSNDDSTVGWS